ncbi:MAG: hypothetical protein RR332_03675, partial [Clostridiales bacterium]
MAKYLKVYRDFSGGLSEDANDNMKDNQLVEAVNTIPGDKFGLQRACGTVLAFPVQTPDVEEIQALLDFKSIGGAVQTLCFTKSHFYKYDSVPGVWTAIAVNPAMTAAVKDYFVYGGKLYWLDGVTMRIYDGTVVNEATLVNSNPSAELLARWGRIKQASFVEQRGQRWFYACADANELYFSNIGSPCEFAGNNIFNINTKNADTITGLQEFSEGLLIFKEKSVHYLTGWDFAGASDLDLSQLNVTSGTCFDKSIQVVENAVLYLGYNGVYELSLPYYSTTIAAKNIAAGLIGDSLRDNATINAYAEVWDNVYYLTVVNASGIKEYRYYTILKSFWGEFTQNATCYSTAMTENALFIGCKNGYILKYTESSNHYIDVNAGEPVVIPMRAVTKGFDIMGSMVQDSKTKRLLIAAKQYVKQSSHIVLHIKADYHDQEWKFSINLDESVVYGEGHFGDVFWGWQDTVTKEVTINQKAKRIQVTFSADNQAYWNEPIMIYGIAVVY